MLNSKFKWEIIEQSADDQLEESDLLKPVQSLLEKRKIEKCLLTEELPYHDPFLFKDMQKAVERIQVAIDEQQPILIYGDYDIDGVSATAILVHVIRSLNGLVNYYIPNRFYEGYGPNEEAYLQAIGEGYELIITVDNGVSGIEEAKVLAEHQVDYIITDHHQLKEEVPVAYGLLHPEYDETYPFAHLCGAGVAFKLACALLPDGDVTTYELFAMLGTIGDVVSLTDENRTIVKRGLAALRQANHVGLNALASELDIVLSEATETTIGFNIGPVLNAAGRMDEAGLAVDLLLCETTEEAKEVAAQLVYLNTLRQKETQSVLEQAKKQIEASSKKDQKIIVVFNKEWHEGVLGIVAGRLARDLQKAVFVLSEDESGQAKGSARAVEGIHLFELMTNCSSLIDKFGGHALAAGITLPIENLTTFEEALNEQVADIALKGQLVIDETLSLEEVTLPLYEQLQLLAPFGEGNRPPIFRFCDVLITNVACIGNQKQHLKFTLKQGKHKLNVIGFNLAHLAVYLMSDDVFEVVGELKLNEWNGQQSMQLQLLDIRCHEFQLLDLRNVKQYQEFSTVLPHGIKLSECKPNSSVCEHLIVDQLPISREQLLTAIKLIKPLTVTLYPLETNVLLPARERFIFVYQIVKKHQSLLLNDQTFKAFQARGLSKDEVMFSLEVFFEIELVIIRNGSVFYVESAPKRDLETAPKYKRQKQKYKMLEFFELSTRQDLKTLFNKTREEVIDES